MPQLIYKLTGTGHATLDLPDFDDEVMPGVRWGYADQLFTPAYWVSQLWLSEDSHSISNHRLGRSLREEVAACLLGGHGIPAEMGLAAYHFLRDRNLLESAPPSQDTIFAALSQPIPTKTGFIRYRFSRQKARFLYEFLSLVPDTEPSHLTDRQFRDWLMRFRGIGPKTASWITRNWRDSDEVAIIDIHIFRAGLLVDLFSPTECPTRDYFQLEKRFLEFAASLGVRLSALDALIWQQMRNGAKLWQGTLTNTKPEIEKKRSTQRTVKRGGRRCLEATAV